MKIIAFGDIHMDLGGFEKIPGLASADLVLITGDFTNFGGRDEAEKMLKKIKAKNSNVLALPGNLDRPEVNSMLTEAGMNLHGHGRRINGVGLVGLGGSNITPFKTPFEFSEPELAALLAAGYAEINGGKDFILVSHAPPYNTKTDCLNNGIHVGSNAVRRFIEERQPALCITGHIHESAAEDCLGSTHILNPGMIKDGGWIEVFLDNHELQGILHQGF